MLTTRPSGPWSRCDQPCSASFAPPLDGRHHAHVGPPCPGHGPPLKRCRHLSSSRAPIPDVPAIYLVEPTPTNLQAITNDLQKGLYSSVHVNFLSSIPRPLLEDFAAQAAAAGTSEQIAQVFDQYLNFIVTEPDLFSLGMQKEHTYWALNSAKTKDEELDRVVDRIVSGLFSVVVTMGMIPPSSAVRDPKLTVIAGVIPVVSHRISTWLGTQEHTDASSETDTMSERSCGRNDRGQARSQTPRPHPQLKRQPLLVTRAPLVVCCWDSDFQTGPRYP